MNKPTLLILAAGVGSRYGGNKQIDGFGPKGETIMEYSIFDAVRAGFGKVVFIVREEILEMVKEVFLPRLQGKIEVDFVVQSLNSHLPEAYFHPDRKKPFGTAHAVLGAKAVSQDLFASIIALDFYGKEPSEPLAQFLGTEITPALHVMLASAVKNASS